MLNVRYLRIFSGLVFFLAGLYAGASLLLVSLGENTLIHLVPESPAMHLNMAVAFLVTAVGLLASFKHARLAQVAHRTSVALLFVLAGLVSLEYLLDFDLDLDALFGGDPPQIPGLPAGRISVFSLLGVWVMAIGSYSLGRHWFRFLQIAGLLLVVMGMVGFFSVYSTQQNLPLDEMLLRVSLQTSVGLLLIGIGYILYFPTEGYAAVLLLSNQVGTLARGLVVLILVLPSLLALLFIALQVGHRLDGRTSVALFSGIMLFTVLFMALVYLHRLDNVMAQRLEAQQHSDELNAELLATNEELMASNEIIAENHDKLAQYNEELAQLNNQLTNQNQTISHLLTKLEAETEQQYQRLFHNQPLPMWLYDLQTLRIVEVNHAAELKYGYSHEEFLKLTLFDLRPEEEHERLRNSVRAATATESILESGVWLHQLRSGAVIYVEIASHPLQFQGRKCRLVVVQDVTKRLETERRFEDLTQSITDWVLEVDRDLTVVFWNRALERGTGMSLSTVLGKPVMEVLPFGSVPQITELFLSVLRNHQPRTTTAMMELRERTLYVQIYAYRSRQGVAAICRDVTETVESEDQLRQSQNRMVRLIENSFQLTCLLDPLGNIQVANQRAREVLGLADRGYEGINLMSAPGIQQASENVRKDLRQLLRKGQEGHTPVLEIALEGQGQQLWLQCQVKPLAGMEHEPDNLIWEAADVTALKDVEIALRKSDARYKLLAENMPNGIMALVDRDWRYTFIEGSEFRQMHLEPSSLVGKRVINEHFLPDQPELNHHLHIYMSAAFRGTRSATEIQVMDTYYQLWLVPLFDQRYQVEQVLMVTQNINEIKRSQRLVQAREQFIQSMMRALPSFVYAYDIIADRIVFANDQITRMLGYEVSELMKVLERGVEQLAHPDDQAAVVHHLMQLRDPNISQPLQLEARFKHKNGTFKWISVNHVVFSRLANNAVEQFLGAAYDVSDLKKVEQDLLEAKLAAEDANMAKSNFLANMSHEIRNPINAMLGVGQLLAKNYQHDEKLVNYTNLLNTSGKRLLNTIGDVLNMAKIEANRITVNMVTLHLNHVLQEACILHETLAERKGVDYNCAIDNAPVYIQADENLLHQVLNNLMGNALKFTDKGRLDCRLEVVAKDGRRMAQITIADTGVGMSDDFVQNRIFQPFEQESRGLGRNYEGSGLGLFLSKKFTELMGGSISLVSAVGKGTTVTLLFPAL